MNPLSDSRILPPGLAGRLNPLCDEFENQWLANSPPPIEAFITRVDVVDRSALVLELLLLDCHYRRHRGENPQASDYRGRLADYAGVVDEYFSHNSTIAVEATQASADRLADAAQRSSRFHVIRPHASGGLGKVWVARDAELGREVALKEILDRHADNPVSRARFVREARITGSLEHPGIVPVYGLGRNADGRPFYAMRFIKGETLGDAIVAARQLGDGRESPLALRRLLARFVAVCDAMQYAHDQGILHRDLKPDNVMLGRYGETLVVDWGLAKAYRGESQGQERSNDTSQLPPDDPSESDPGKTSPGSHETVAGVALGTPVFMSPEQALGELDRLGPTSDVFSLGATLYTILTGQKPHAGKAPAEVLAAARAGQSQRPCEVDASVPRALDAVCMRARAVDPADRYPSARALADDIERWLADEPVTAWREPWTTRLRRIAMRYRTAVATAGAALGVSVVGLLITTTLLSTANEALLTEQKKVNQVNLSLAAESDRVSKTNDELRDERANVERANRELVAAVKRLDATNRQLGRAIDDLDLSNERIARDLASTSTVLAMNHWSQGHAKLANDVLDRIDSRFRDEGWEYAKRRSEGSLLTFYGHVDAVTAVCFDLDGDRLASSSLDGTIRIWDVRRGRPSFTLKGHRGAVHGVSFRPDGRRLASSGADGAVKIWDPQKGREVSTLTGHKAAVERVLFSPFGGLLASGSVDGNIKFWSAEDGREVRSLHGGTSAVRAISFSPDGERVASVFADGALIVWRVRDGQRLLEIVPKAPNPQSVSYSVDGRRLAIQCADGSVRLCDACDGRLLLGFRELHGGAAIDHSPDGRLIGVAGSDARVHLYNASSGRQVHAFVGHLDRVTALNFSPNGQFVASGAHDMTVKVWSVRDGEEMLTIRESFHHANDIEVNSDGSRLFVGWNDGRIKMYDANSGRDLKVLAKHGGPIRSVALSHDDILAFSGDDPRIALWDWRENRARHMLEGHKATVNQIVFSPDGRLLLSASNDLTARLWNTKTGESIATFAPRETPTKKIVSVAFNPNGRSLAVADVYGLIGIWATGTNTRLMTIRGQPNGINHICYSPDGKTLAGVSADGTTKLWNAETGDPQLTLEGHSDGVASVRFSPKGGRMATSGHDLTIRVWNACNGRELAALSGQRKVVRAIRFFPDGRRLVTASEDNTIKVWDVRGREASFCLEGATANIRATAFSSDGSRLIAREITGEQRIWDTATRSLTSSEKPAPAEVPRTRACLSPGGERIAYPFANRVAILPLVPSPEEQDFTHLATQLDLDWHVMQMSRQRELNHLDAAAFHRGWIASNRPAAAPLWTDLARRCHEIHESWQKDAAAGDCRLDKIELVAWKPAIDALVRVLDDQPDFSLPGSLLTDEPQLTSCFALALHRVAQTKRAMSIFERQAPATEPDRLRDSIQSELSSPPTPRRPSIPAISDG